MIRNKLFLLFLSLLSAALLSLPWLVPHTGFLALVAFVPLLCADAMAAQLKIKSFWLYVLICFIAWNTATTFWVCEATVGGGIFAIVANSLQMLLVWLLYKLSAKVLKKGPLPYIFFAAMWIAWEKQYFNVDISWPWLTLGNAFADSTKLVQWYEYTGTMGGSLWIWLCNLGVFGLISAISDGFWSKWKKIASISAVLGVILVISCPIILSNYIYDSYQEKSQGQVDVVIAQPNFDPYQKFEYLSQAQQNEVLVRLFDTELADFERSENPLLLLAPETFTSDIDLNYIYYSPTVKRLKELLTKADKASLSQQDTVSPIKILFGASTFEFIDRHSKPHILAREYGNQWMLSHNSALMMGPEAQEAEVYHKSKLVIGTEKTPYPKIFVPLDDYLSKKLGVSSLMGRCIEQDEVSVLHIDNNIPVGCAVCYESVYGEHCSEYVRKGAKLLTVITNDAWWGNTPGYKQHLNYSRLRAIELRRDVARCGNTGISCFIDQKGDILKSTPWWQETTLSGRVNLNSELTFFTRYGDIAGRISTLVFLLLAALVIVKAVISKKS